MSAVREDTRIVNEREEKEKRGYKHRDEDRLEEKRQPIQKSNERNNRKNIAQVRVSTFTYELSRSR